MDTPSAHPARTALITGASSGIGAEYAHQLAERGWALVLVARRENLIEKLGAELGERYGVPVEPLAADLTDTGGLERVVGRLRSGDGKGAGIDLLVNNAGIGGTGAFDEQDTDAIQRLLDLNMQALVRLTRAALGDMTERRGRGHEDLLGVINVSSVAGMLAASPGSAVYSATKAFVTSFGESVAAEVGKHGINVTTVQSGFVRTEMTRGLQERGMPAIGWVAKERVVRDSLHAMARGKSSVVPGAQYKAADKLLRLIPRSAFRAAARRFG